ncbi:hypothetical protein BCR33DRAFT_498186 [Rhizoclosmatium globosum]|uniref:Uncharacterized protein n=1 Tax=Rhizoclosmatium globosum TaxID=329046 RepID=A0A1Y2CVS1_9FUNG|nr:hypothetical protein BCR33DRAFT_498186 [Rhizoclosmatium globosum]|eukprot:ORY50914.1 hypothetical protein BCR33DRAFT_498186 [Rhizoclosmatium globosum]
MITDERRVLLFQLLFLGTGVISTIGAQWVKYRGAANSISFVTSLCQFMGMILVAALPPPKTLLAKPRTLTVQPSGSFLDRIKSHLSLYGPVSIKGAALLSTLEVSGNLINVAGMFLTGSGLYMVIYSSIVVFTAMFSKLLLPSSRQLNTTQWISVFAICFGLAITAIESSGHHDKSGEAVLLGIVICLVGTGLHSLVYVGTDHLLATEASTPIRSLFMSGCSRRCLPWHYAIYLDSNTPDSSSVCT